MFTVPSIDGFYFVSASSASAAEALYDATDRPSRTGPALEASNLDHTALRPVLPGVFVATGEHAASLPVSHA